MKKIILIIIIVAGFGGAIVMAIMAMRAGTADTPQLVAVPEMGTGISGTASSNPLSAILPEGKNLDFSKVEEFNEDGLLFPFPEVSPLEVGANLGTIIE